MSYDPATVPRTWAVSRQQAQEVAALADALNVNHSRLVRYLLAFSLAEIAAGRLVLKTRPSRYELVDDQ